MLIKLEMKHPKKASKHISKKCKYCREWYKETIRQTKKIKDKFMRERLLHLWKTLWLNNCGDFDIICYEFAHYDNTKK